MTLSAWTPPAWVRDLLGEARIAPGATRDLPPGWTYGLVFVSEAGENEREVRTLEGLAIYRDAHTDTPIKLVYVVRDGWLLPTRMGTPVPLLRAQEGMDGDVMVGPDMCPREAALWVEAGALGPL